MNITVRVWRQAGPEAAGKMVSYEVPDVSEHMSFLEMLDVLNERLTMEGDDPIAFDHDCREGICGACGVVINGTAHGRADSAVPTTTCQLHMRSFSDGDVIDVEPWRAEPFPVIKDLVVDRGRLRPDHPGRRLHLGADRHRSRRPRGPGAQGGGGPRLRRGHLHRLRRLRRGLPERLRDAVHRGQGDPPGSAAAGTAGAEVARGAAWSHQHDEEGFGGCTNIGECTAVCPKGIPFETISRLNRDLLGAMLNPQS